MNTSDFCMGLGDPDNGIPRGYSCNPPTRWGGKNASLVSILGLVSLTMHLVMNFCLHDDKADLFSRAEQQAHS